MGEVRVLQNLWAANRVFTSTSGRILWALPVCVRILGGCGTIVVLTTAPACTALMGLATSPSYTALLICERPGLY
ncbi:unnamed protein product [Staurois parvus]|uniref:Uncharacterized protein n=1 Tax=Staurois parvus TaxID=386267 RepID=A0ABN9AP26_9NEOB|nr:unnamed protein product [Staurois parvus]